MIKPITLEPVRLLGKLSREDEKPPIDGAAWFTALDVGDGLFYTFPAGSLASMRYLTADILVDGNHKVVFNLNLQEGEKGRKFTLLYAALNQVSARIRMKLEAVNQNRWRFDREGAWLKPMCAGERVDLAKVDRMEIIVARKSSRPARWCQTPVVACAAEPPLLKELLLPKGPVIDEMGQSTIHEWPAKSRSTKEVTERLKEQLAAAPSHRWPSEFSRWGGWTKRQFKATGFFRTENDGKRWWLVDPDGYAFWSAGMDCVRVNTDAAYAGLEKALAFLPDPKGEFKDALEGRRGNKFVNYLAINLIRAFGPKDWYKNWSKIALAELKRMGFNTVANWSDWKIAREAGFPYVRPMELRYKRTPMVYRDFPDVFHPGFKKDAEDFAKQLKETAEDPAFIGYFMMNEPTWGFASETPAAGMLFNTASCKTRDALADFLAKKYGKDESLAAAWGFQVTLKEAKSGTWKHALTPAARADLEKFSSVMCERKFKTFSDACRRADPNHLNLGIRYYTVPPAWAADGMKSFDVFSVNGYSRRVRKQLAEIAEMFNQPVMIGEWHFGALDAGLPASGIGHVKDQADRGKAFRIYTEDAAALPWCVGVHYFTLYDESALGRFDGENWNIGFMDVCNRPYQELSAAARASHEKLYEVASGAEKPFSDEPTYLPELFL